MDSSSSNATHGFNMPRLFSDTNGDPLEHGEPVQQNASPPRATNTPFVPDLQQGQLYSTHPEAPSLDWSQINPDPLSSFLQPLPGIDRLSPPHQEIADMTNEMADEEAFPTTYPWDNPEWTIQ